MNSITQYVLIAVNQQRYLTRAFLIGVTFNVVGNILVIPGFGYIGSAVVTILSEFSLLFPFYARVKRHVGIVPWLSVFAGPVVAVAVMGAAIYGVNSLGSTIWLSVLIGAIVYLIALVGTGALRHEDMDVIEKTLPLQRWRQQLLTRLHAVKINKR